MYYFVAAHSFSILCGRDPICQERSSDGFIKAKIKIIESNLIVFGLCRSRLNRPLCQFLAENIRKQKSCKTSIKIFVVFTCFGQGITNNLNIIHKHSYQN